MCISFFPKEDIWIYLWFVSPSPSIGKPPDIAKQRVNYSSCNLCYDISYSDYLPSCVLTVYMWSILLALSDTLACITISHDADREQRQAQCRTYNEVQEKCWYSYQVSWFLRNLFAPSQSWGDYYNLRRDVFNKIIYFCDFSESNKLIFFLIIIIQQILVHF